MIVAAARANMEIEEGMVPPAAGPNETPMASHEIV
jgi:hypothetical protein